MKFPKNTIQNILQIKIVAGKTLLEVLREYLYEHDISQPDEFLDAILGMYIKD